MENFFVKKQLLPVFLGSFQIIMYLCARTQVDVGFTSGQSVTVCLPIRLVCKDNCINL